jgi:predicted amidophosphoribosyltransferase
MYAYSPRGISEAEKSSRSVMRAIKDDMFLSSPPLLTSEYISNALLNTKKTLPFADFFEADPILVPVPNSSLMRPGTLWVSERLAKAMHENGLGKRVITCLRRQFALRKSATSQARDRPKAAEHFESLEVQRLLSDPHEILLVDDIITRGATLSGAANRLRSVYPAVKIRAFAAMRTISSPPFNDYHDPCIGTIMLSDRDTFRSP